MNTCNIKKFSFVCMHQISETPPAWMIKIIIKGEYVPSNRCDRECSAWSGRRRPRAGCCGRGYGTCSNPPRPCSGRSRGRSEALWTCVSYRNGWVSRNPGTSPAGPGPPRSARIRRRTTRPGSANVNKNYSIFFRVVSLISFYNTNTFY